MSSEAFLKIMTEHAAQLGPYFGLVINCNNGNNNNTNNKNNIINCSHLEAK